jgi:hypothetical protein
MARIPRRIVPSVEPAPLSPAEVKREVRTRLAAGARLRVIGEGARDPARLLARYAPRHAIDLFDTTFYLADVRQNQWVRFFVAWLVQAARPREIHARLFYKDVSLVWRVASHLSRMGGDLWIGKGDVQTTVVEDDEMVFSDEATTDLPLEIQTALETVMRRAARVPRDERALHLVLRRAPDGRIQAYRDFVEPRRRAQADRRNLVNRGRPIARFTRRHDPASLVFAAGFEPDFARGVVEVAHGTSSLYGGALRRFRIVSRNGEAQYLFFAGPRHDWIASVQATSAELSSFGVRTIDVAADEELTLPGWEYHYLHEHEGEPALHSQIPPGFAGERHPEDELRADASAWHDRMPVIREFRRAVLGRARPRGAPRAHAQRR